MAAGMLTQGDLNTVPNLPGYGYKKKPKSFLKAQTFNYCNGLPIEQKEGVTFERPKLVKFMKPADVRRVGTLPESTTLEDFKETAPRPHTELPAWDALDRHVLRFYGYFRESVVETNLENYRVRQVVIYYYLEDDTCQIIERKQENSGIPQGQVLRRHRFPGPSGGYLSWQDLRVGGDLHIYGRTIRIVDCDAWSRAFCESEGVEQDHPEPVEEDAFARSLVKEQVPPGIPKTAERHYNEVMLGGGHINQDMQQFLEWDRKVLRFFAVQDDLSLPQFERRPFVILYFLADDTVEIREQYPLNCGRDNFPIFFRRAKMPRGKADALGPLAPAKKKEEYVAATDFTVGKMHELMGYQFYIYDADVFTRQWFEEEAGQVLPQSQDVRLPERTVPRPKTPPYTGYGSWGDSMASVTHLIPKPPKKDFKKLYYNDGKVLRFTAQYFKAKPEDAERLFVINFHLFDDTLSIHEPPQRNIGIITGKYLEKAVHFNQHTGQLFKPQDLYPGAVVKVYNREFEILDMDEYTRNYIESSDSGRRYDLCAVLEKLRESMRQQFPLVRDVFRRFDTDHDGVLTVAEFKQALEKYGFQLADEEILVLMKHFDQRKDGQVSYNEFCDALLDEDYTTAMMQAKAPLDQTFDADYAARAQRKTEERVETELVRDAARRLGDVVYKQIHTFTKLFKEFGHMTHQQTVTTAQIVEAFRQTGHHFPIEDVTRALLFVMPQADPEAIDYVEFLKAVTTSYHDLAHTR
mmetsp:Transcript_81867/g.228093  ORF Transcript_81867/g.228093 Transcript_81867/m.228093 type:complete len:747 (+) Transcript_81867:82-2322(+)